MRIIGSFYTKMILKTNAITYVGALPEFAHNFYFLQDAGRILHELLQEINVKEIFFFFFFFVINDGYKGKRNVFKKQEADNTNIILISYT